ncbi:transcription factor NF-E2 45 kDa subunit [Bombina bombina]|uniref:transcription factor NF-E2 45 kDa subunit n=1 Tax=Bombina bombina TaxID=8345 RepID=UPI00235AD3F9|nr:transcription factor NF-E2 45 kDa subunit [Bombina bombina]XP_053560984.1 transcription factor NF-E2 45 kDa subunit [Bombina bombina]
MPPCLSPGINTYNTLVPTLKGEQFVQGDMDLTWQEILSINELQDLDVHCDSTYNSNGYGTVAPILMSGYGSGNVPEGMTQMQNQNIPLYERSYSNPIHTQPQKMNTASSYGPTAYTGMLISSSMNQMATINNSALKTVHWGGLPSISLIDHLNVPNMGKSNVNPHKNQEDFESDSGLSLNFSDGESMEMENIESQRLHSEYIQMLPPLAYQGQYLTSTTEPVTGHDLTNAYVTSETPDLLCNRDERRAAAMNIPFPIERIVNLPVEDFNELLTSYSLTEAQLGLVRDIRRRGKNKVAAQNCRKRKMETITSLEREIGHLQIEREVLRKEQAEVQRLMGDLKRDMRLLQEEVSIILQDQGTHQYQSDDVLLKQTDNGFFDLQTKELEHLN